MDMNLDPIVPDDPSIAWMERGLCSKERPVGESDDWFPDSGAWREGRTLEVIAVCLECPVREQCLAYAMEMEGTIGEPHRYGIYGAMTPGQRARLARGFDEKPHDPRRTHCREGHEYTPENTINRDRERNGRVEHYRACRECDRNYRRAKRAGQEAS